MPDPLRSNPLFPPPDRPCVIHKLPTELLSHIFLIGVEESDNSNDSDSYGGDHSLESAQRTEECVDLVSHVCRLWRDIAIQTPALWANILFEGKHDDCIMAQQYFERSRALPVSISIDLTPNFQRYGWHQGYENDTARRILECVIPHISRWCSLSVKVSDYALMGMILMKLGDCTGAPLLERLELYSCRNGRMSYNTFTPQYLKKQHFVLFGGNVPRLTHVTLSGVHLDWPRSHFLSGLTSLQLAFHAQDVCPTYMDLTRILRDSPRLTTLSLYHSGPASPPTQWVDVNEEAELAIPIMLDYLKELVLVTFDNESIIPLLNQCALPNLTSLSLDLQSSSSTSLQALGQPSPTTGTPLLSGLTSLKIGRSMTDVEDLTIMEVYAAAPKLTLLDLHMRYSHSESQWFHLLFGSPPISASVDIPLLKLETLRTSGVHSAAMHTLVEVRRDQGVPLRCVSMNKADIDVGVIDDRDWLRKNVEVFELFAQETPDTDIGFFVEDPDDEEEYLTYEAPYGFDSMDDDPDGPEDEVLEYWRYSGDD
ncbi:hypothetical protein B0H21DRAFT_688901 [Amylocystis lapponica]|nr:hypothetical protein B0H21DRAFT_688901 [Amylocystis lapponica]